MRLPGPKRPASFAQSAAFPPGLVWYARCPSQPAPVVLPVTSDETPARDAPGSPRAFAVLLGVLVLLVFGWSEWVTWTQFQANRIFVADAGIFDHLCNSPLHGRWMRSPVHWETGVTQFAAHYTPIFLFVTPLYLLVDHVMTYLTFQNAGLVLAAVPLAFWARRVLKHDAAALAVAALYLCNHFTGSIHLANHQEALGPLGFFAMFLALERRSPRLYAAGMLWALCCKETYALVIGLFGLHLAIESLRDRELRGWAGWTLGVAAAWWVFSLAVIQLSGAAIYSAAGNTPIARYHTMGDSMGSVFVYLLTHPVETLGRMLRRPVLDLLLSTGLVALADWRAVWLVVVAAGLYGVADDVLVRDLHYYYSYPALPLLFYATVRGAGALVGWSGARGLVARRGVAVLFAVVGVVSIWLPTRTDGLRRWPIPASEHQLLAAEVAREIPRDAPVAAQYELFNKVPNRRIKLPVRLPYLDEVEYVFLDQTQFPADLRGEEKRAEREEVFRRLASPEWEIVFEVDGYVILRRGAGKREKREPRISRISTKKSAD
ncbi:MAG: hypothetical protein PWP23_1895 [Candidatus Sumerlaeota bacterium]|nr:hypothetical protein [Candidatus Sumerlaeota bacterium]